MHSTLTRRSAIASGIILAIFGITDSARASEPGITSLASAILEIDDELNHLVLSISKIERTAQSKFPPLPDACKWLNADVFRHGLPKPVFPEQRTYSIFDIEPLQTAKLVKWIFTGRRGFHESHDNIAAMARRDEIVRCLRQHQNTCDAVEEAEGLPAAERELDEKSQRFDVLMDKLIATRSNSFNDLQSKAMVLSKLPGSKSVTAETTEALTASLISDLTSFGAVSDAR